MVIINGRELKEKKLEQIRNNVEELESTLGLAVVQVGDDEASKVYIKQKEKAATELGYKYIHKHFPADVTEEELIKEIEKLTEEIKKDNDTMTDIIVRMRTDGDFFEVVKTLHSLDDVKLAGVMQLLQAFNK